MNFKIGFENNSQMPMDFIDNFLCVSNPTYFIIYLYTFRRVFNGETTIEFSDISMEIEAITENDCLACFKYFEKKGIIEVQENEIIFLPIYNKSIKIEERYEENFEDLVEENTEFEELTNIEVEKRPVYDMKEIDYYRKHNASFSNLFSLAEKCFGRTLQTDDVYSIFDIYDRLLLPAEVIEYLIEHYTSKKGITNMKYIEKVAAEWYDKGIKSKDDAIRLVNYKNEDYMKVRKALGMNSRRDKTDAEDKMLDKFYNEYGFELDIILEACDAAIMSSKDSPTYNYLEGILANWYKEGIKTLEDVKKRNKEIADNRKRNNNSKTKKTLVDKTSKNKFSNFSQKSLDFDKYEKLNRERLEKLTNGDGNNGQ